jgi:DNA-binding PadR family transcriptional regulator
MGRNQRITPHGETTTTTTTTTRGGRRPERPPFDAWDGPARNGRGRPGGGWGPPPARRGGGRRARRGDVRAAMLALLAERPMHGYEMIGELSDRTSGAWSPSPGSVYPTLQLLEEEGLVTAEEVDGKRRFSLTGEGRAQVEAAAGPAPWERFADGPAEEAEVRAAVNALLPAVQQVMAVGSAAQQGRAAEVLVDARRRLYEILAAAD